MNKLTTTKKRNLSKANRNDLIFYVLMVSIPVLQFFIFYVCVNFNSILMAFQRLDIDGKVLNWTFLPMKNAFKSLFTEMEFISAAGRSLQAYAVGLLIGMPLGLFFSYYIYKKLPLGGLFRVLLFLPSILSGIVMVTMYKFFISDALPNLMEQLFHYKMGFTLLEDATAHDTVFATVLFFNVWSGFGGSVLMYSNAMSGISPEQVESAHIDGATGIREFWYITLPGVFPTLSTFLIAGVAGIFSNQSNLFSFYGATAKVEIRTYGYEMYIRTLNGGYTSYPALSAIGLIMTFVAIPLTYLVKWALEKFGPKED